MFGSFQKTSETVQKCFSDVFMIFFLIFEKSSEIFGKLENGSKVFFRCFIIFQNFREIFGNLWNSSKIIGKFENVRTFGVIDL